MTQQRARQPVTRRLAAAAAVHGALGQPELTRCLLELTAVADRRERFTKAIQRGIDAMIELVVPGTSS